ncbi:hypothetical protein ACVBEG_27830 [Pseudomonas sp. GG8]
MVEQFADQACMASGIGLVSHRAQQGFALQSPEIRAMVSVRSQAAC